MSRGAHCLWTFAGKKRYHSAGMALKIRPIDIHEFLAVPVAGGRFRGPSRVEVDVVDEPGLPYDATLTIELQDDRYVCRSATVTQRKDGPPVTAASIRSLPVASIVRRSVEDLITPVRGEEIAPDGSFKREMDFPVDIPTARRRRRRGEDVKAAAVIYAVALRCGQPPTKAVADDLDIPLGTARRLVAQAKQAGLLPTPASIAAGLGGGTGTHTITTSPPT
jgi:hypothetical protein